MPGDPGPLVRRRQLGSALRHYREAAGLTAKDVADRLLSSPAKISRIELAQRNASLRDVRDFCEIYGISDERVRDQLMGWAREGRERGWWQGAGLDPAIERMIGLEGSAERISEFELATFPGLLQAPGYVRAMMDAFGPADAGIREKMVDTRLRRKIILDGTSAPDFDVVLDEAVLRRAVGGRAVMREQLGHVLDLVAHSVVTVRIVPFSAGAYLGMIQGFVIMDFADQEDPGPEAALSTVVYTEALNDGYFLDQPASVELYRSTFERIQAQALPATESAKMIKEILVANP